MVQLFTIFRHHHQQHLYNDILWIKEFINKPVNFLSRADHDGSSQLSWLKFVLCLSSSLSSLSSSKTFDIFIFTLFSRSTGPISLSLAQRILRWSKFKCTQMMYDWLVVHCIMSRINIFILFISRRHNCQWRATQREIIAKSWKYFFLFSVTNRTWHIAIIWSKIVRCLSSSSAKLLTIFIFCSSAIGPMSNKVGIKHSWVKYKYIQMYRIVWLIDYILIYVTLEHFHLDWDASIAGEGPHKRK